MTVRRLALIALLLAAVGVIAAPVPKVESEPGPTTKKELRVGRQRMSALILAMHNYESTYQTLPANVTDGKGNVLLSWRVLLLPYLEQEELFKKFDLTEAWDGKNNRKLIDEMPDCFAPARGKTKNRGETFYQGFEGKGTVFQPGRAAKLANLPDGTSNTIALIEAGEPVTWTKPEDLPFNPKAPLPKMGGVFDGEFFVALCDGSVRVALTRHIHERNFRIMVTADDAEVNDSDAAFGWDWKRR